MQNHSQIARALIESGFLDEISKRMRAEAFAQFCTKIGMDGVKHAADDVLNAAYQELAINNLMGQVLAMVNEEADNLPLPPLAAVEHTGAEE